MLLKTSQVGMIGIYIQIHFFTCPLTFIWLHPNMYINYRVLLNLLCYFIMILWVILGRLGNVTGKIEKAALKVNNCAWMIPQSSLNFMIFHYRKSLFTPYGERSDRGYFALSLQTDLEPIFNWNVKQLFLYLTAEYKTKANVSHKNNLLSNVFYFNR